jgi:hypothetical protein
MMAVVLTANFLCNLAPGMALTLYDASEDE